MSPLLERIFAAGQGRLRRTAMQSARAYAALRRAACGRLDCRTSQQCRRNGDPLWERSAASACIAGAALCSLAASRSALAQPVDMAAAKSEGKVVWYTLGADRDRAEGRQHVRAEDRHQGRAVPLRRLQHPAPLPAGGRRRQGLRRRAHPFGARSRAHDDQEGPVRAVQGGGLRQGAGRGQGPRRLLRRAAPQRDGDVRARRQAARRRPAEDLGRPRRSPNTRARW